MKKKPAVLVTSRLPEKAVRLLKRHCIVDIHDADHAMSRKSILKRIRDKEGLICLLTNTIDAAIINAGKKLAVIANVAVGYDNIDTKEATKRGIAVTNTPDVLTETTADLAFALLLCVARRIVEADKYLHKGMFKGWTPTLFVGHDVHNATLGIVGFGRIGSAIAQRAHGFKMRVLYYNPTRLPQKTEDAYGIHYRKLDDLLRESDFVTIHAPLTKETHHLISTKELSLMKKTAFLVNTARGAIVDEKALVKALSDGKIAGCALDVYEHEPHIEKKLLTMPNALLVPHIGSASIATRTRMAVLAVENVVSVLIKKEKPSSIVNPEVYT